MFSLFQKYIYFVLTYYLLNCGESQKKWFQEQKLHIFIFYKHSINDGKFPDPKRL